MSAQTNCNGRSAEEFVADFHRREAFRRLRDFPETIEAINAVLGVEDADELSQMATELSYQEDKDGVAPPEAFLACLLDVLANGRTMIKSVMKLIAILEMAEESGRPLQAFLTKGGYEFSTVTLKSLYWHLDRAITEGEEALYREGKETLDRLVPDYRR